MLKFFRNLFSSEGEDLDVLHQELENFIKYVVQLDKRGDYPGLYDRLVQFKAYNVAERLIYLPGFYLFVEYLVAKTDELRNSFQTEILQQFPKITSKQEFKFVFETQTVQEEYLAKMFIDLVWDKSVDLIGDAKKEILQNYHSALSKGFKKLAKNQLTHNELQSTLKYEVYNVYNSLSNAVGKEKVNQWMQSAHQRIHDNYVLLPSFSFALGLLPEFLLTEQQISTLTRAQIEGILIERTQLLEETNARLREEIEEKELAQKALSENANRLNKIVESALDAVILMNSAGMITFWNSQAESVFGWKSDEVSGKRLSEFLIPEHLRDSHEKGLKKYLENGEYRNLGRRIEQVALTKSGDSITIELSVVASEILGDQLFTAFIRDITARKNYESELKTARDRAEKASKAKANFLSTMSHEIRTPMNGLFGTIELLLSEKPREDQVESLNIMKHSTESLLVILNDILDFSKIEEGHIEFDKREFSLKELNKRIISTFKAKAEEKGIELVLDQKFNSEYALLGDPVRLSQILNNLISNAIKFTYKGSVTLKVEIAKETSSHLNINFSVIDTGVGIPEKQLERVFERFTQVENQREQHMQSGTGLGLAICKKLLELQGSDLLVVSKEGQGSTFYFEIMLPKTEGKTLPKGEELSASKNLDGLKVLLVEDNKVNQIVANKFLVKWNCEVDFANHGKEATSMIQSQKYDIVLMDIQMPEMDGFEATSIIRNMDGNYFKKIPIIALTADVLPGVRQQADEAGMNDLMTKPFDPEKLYFTITSNL